MASHTTIVSFDDIKRSVSGRVDSEGSARGSRARAERRRDDSAGKDFFWDDSAWEDRAGDGPAWAGSAWDDRPLGDMPTRSSRSTDVRARNAARVSDERRRPRERARRQAAAQMQEDARGEGADAPKVGVFRKRRRARAKAHADRLFDRHYAASEPHEANGESRAAVYTGKIGARQRRAARMEPASQAGAVWARRSPATAVAAFFSRFNFSRRATAVVVGLFCIVIACAFLYVPAQQYYQSMREGARLEAEHELLQERNDALAARNEALGNDAGVESAVHDQYGWVKKGEHAATVEGLSETGDAKAEGQSALANVLPDEVKAPVTWYSPVLDAVFGYPPQA